MRNRETLIGAASGKQRDVPQHHQCVLIHRIDMEQVELHAPGDAGECRNPLAQHAQPRHAIKRFHRTRAAQQRHEELAGGGIGNVVRRKLAQHLGQRARSQRMQAAHLAMCRPVHEQCKHLQHIVARPAVRVGSQIAAT